MYCWNVLGHIVRIDIGHNPDIICPDYCIMFVRVDICQQYLEEISLRIQVPSVCEGKYCFQK